MHEHNVSHRSGQSLVMHMDAHDGAFGMGTDIEIKLVFQDLLELFGCCIR